MKNIYMKQISCLGAMLLLIGTTISSVEAFGPGDGEGMERRAKDFFEREMKHEGEMLKEIMDDLDLTDEQQANIKALREQERKQSKEDMKIMHAARKKLHAELEKYDHDQNNVDALIEELTVGHEQMLRNRTNGIVAMKQILTQEQFAMMRDKIKFKRDVRKEVRKMMKRERRGGPFGHPPEHHDEDRAHE